MVQSSYIVSRGIRVRIPQELDVVAFWSWTLNVVVFQSWNLDVVAFCPLKKCLEITMLWVNCCGSSLVSLDYFTTLVDRAGNCYMSLYFLFLLFFYVYSIQNFKICCCLVLPVPFSSVLTILLFSTLLSIACSVFSLCLFALEHV